MHVRKINGLDHADGCKCCQLYSTCTVLTITSYRIILQHILIGGASMKRRGGEKEEREKKLAEER